LSTVKAANVRFARRRSLTRLSTKASKPRSVDVNVKDGGGVQVVVVVVMDGSREEEEELLLDEDEDDEEEEEDDEEDDEEEEDEEESSLGSSPCCRCCICCCCCRCSCSSDRISALSRFKLYHNDSLSTNVNGSCACVLVYKKGANETRRLPLLRLLPLPLPLPVPLPR